MSTEPLLDKYMRLLFLVGAEQSDCFQYLNRCLLKISIKKIDGEINAENDLIENKCT
jgi:hypothetical protein